MEDHEDSLREEPAPPTPADIAEQLEQAEKRRLLAQAGDGPLTRAIRARNTNRISHPDAAMAREMEFRKCPPPPADLLGAPDGEYMSEAVQKACRYLHDQWGDIHEASRNRDVSLDQLSRAGQRVLNVALKPLEDCRVELDKGIADCQRRIDAVAMRHVDSALAQDIRRAFREKPVPDAIRSDWRVASAVLSAPRIVLGASEAQMAAWRDLAEQSHAAEHLASRQKLVKLHAHCARAANLAIERLRPALLRWTAQQSEAMKRLLAS